MCVDRYKDVAAQKGHSGHLITGLIFSGEVRGGGEERWKRNYFPIKTNTLLFSKYIKIVV